MKKWWNPFPAPPQPPELPVKGKRTLKTEGLYKFFGRKAAVNDVHFTMETGEIVGLLGPNGAGKTTTFYMIVGFIKPSQGTVLLDQINITSFPMYKRAQMGLAYLPQEPSVFRKLTVEQNIYAALDTRTDLNKAQRQEKLAKFIEDFGLKKVYKQQAYTLSGGERRRTEIARALATKPSFLMLDEPFAGIDPIAVDDIKQIIRALAEQGIGILITDHNVRDTLEVTDRAYILYLGNLVVEGTKQEIINNSQAKQLYLGENFRL